MKQDSYFESKIGKYDFLKVMDPSEGTRPWPRI
jgi:hypothetical protein